jgi:competence protein ComEC
VKISQAEAANMTSVSLRALFGEKSKQNAGAPQIVRMNKLYTDARAAIAGVKLPFYGFAGALAAYYGLASAYAGGNPAKVLIPASALAVCACVLRVLASRRVFCPKTRRNGLRKATAAYVFFVLGFALGTAGRVGAVREGAFSPGQNSANISALGGKLLDDPRTSASGYGLAGIDLRYASGKNGVRTSARGIVTAFFPDGSIPRLKDFGRGSEIYIEGGFAKQSAESYYKTPLFRAKSVHITRPAPRFEQWRTKTRLAIADAFSQETYAEKDWGGLALALLLGIRDNLDGELSEQYRKSGCSYILALSGMHLALVSSVIAFFLKKPLGLKAAAGTGAVCILLYVFLVGVQASLIRAAIMYVLGAAAIVCAFPLSPGLLLGFSFVIQILTQPASGDSVAFILSYLALAGILALGQGGLFRGHLPDFAASPLSASLGAFLATMPICLLFFGSLRPVGIIAGLVLIPLTTVFMAGAFVFLATLFVIPALAALIGQGLSIVYLALERIVAVAGKAPEVLLPDTQFGIVISMAIPIIIFWTQKIMHKKRVRFEYFS